jgi:hypothetical protein
LAPLNPTEGITEMTSLETIAPPSAATALAEAQAVLDAAAARHRELATAADRARREADDAAASAKHMLDAASAGTGGLTVPEHAAADLRAAQLDHAAGIAEALAQGALRRREQDEIGFYHAKAADHVERAKVAVAADCAAAAEVDDALAAVQAKLRQFRARSAEAHRALSDAARFDDAVPGALAGNVVAQKLQVQFLPKTRIKAQPDVSSFTIDVVWTDLFRRLHTLIGPLAAFRRAGWGSLAPATTDTTITRLRPLTDITGQKTR